jgi:hypothetical protein
MLPELIWQSQTSMSTTNTMHPRIRRPALHRALLPSDSYGLCIYSLFLDGVDGGIGCRIRRWDDIWQNEEV